jgi:hypothetical protein
LKRPWFPTEPVDEEFFQTAPFLIADTFEIPRSAAQVWAELTGEHPLSWCRLLRDVSWTSPRPFGAGTTRTVRTVDGAGALRERFFRWEEGRRKSFYVLESSLPLFRRFAEDYLVEPSSETACSFTWTIAVEPRPFVRPADPVNRALLSTLFSDTRRHFIPR